MKGQLTIIGGSTPFTAAFADAIEARGEAVPPRAMMLNGRNPRSLPIVARYVRNRLSRLGWSVDWSTDLSTALSGSEIVLHQARYGGNEGRQEDEELALACGVVPDETLGPAVLQSALRMSPMLDTVCRVIVKECPDAWVLNLTNPLSIATARMVQCGVSRCIGVCELPRVTAQKAAAVLGEDLAQATWSYAGMNHRGFVVGLSWNDTDRIAEVARRLGRKTLDGIEPEQITDLGAIPTKYFSLLRGDAPTPALGRAAFLEGLRTRLLDELRAHPEQSPPSLAQRYLAWYPQAVVPLIEALSSEHPMLLEVNTPTHRGLVEEGRAPVSSAGVGAFVPAKVPSPVQYWIDRFIEHERYLLDAVEHPCPATIRRALAADPLVAPGNLDNCVRLVRTSLNHLQARMRSEKS